MCNSVLHVMSDHHCCQMIAVYDHLSDLKDLGCCFRVKGCGMLIEEQKLWFLEGCHQQSKCLTLSTGEKSDFGSKAIFQSKAKNLQKFFIFFAFFLCDSGFKETCFSAAFCKGKVFFNSHCGSCSCHRILEYASQVSCSFVLG